MEAPSTPPTPPTPPPRQATGAKPINSRPHPEVFQFLDERRLRARAIPDRSLAAEASSSSLTTPHNLKRSHASISHDGVPSTVRDARITPTKLDEASIQPARKFKQYVDHDFSKMTDTKGGFLTVEDDPWNKVLHAPSEKGGGKPAHMTLAEWERLQLLKDLRRTKSGPFEPGLSILKGDAGEREKCRECKGMEIDWVWLEVFGVAVCGKCKDKWPERYSLLTKTEAKDDYLLTDSELKDPDLLPHLNKPNPHKSHWHDMMLFLRFQVETYAFSPKKWGSAEALDAEFEKRENDKKVRKEAKFKSKLKELKKKTRTEAYRRQVQKGGGRAEFGDRVGNGKHEHEWGQVVVDGEGNSVKSCLECGMEVEELEF
ncbi:XPA protein C-terminus-domain-containing protein [Amylocarpus encephaloides]|uniref:DNA repair protein RAD14 n=1 Tax=Amylocarpus encephaloides TaxID=45428 RepID=A0A9P8C5H6_9HELO|nr:XPA protein C-terminus-domain-containing protein [Amylocarpus encephaloides]